MNKILLLSFDTEDRLYDLENDTLVEYESFARDKEDLTGTILCGRVVSREPSLEAASVDIGLKEPAFLQLSHEDFPALKNGQDVLVQVEKLPEGRKRLAVTMRLTFPGQFVVLTPSDPRISVSAKITDSAERSRLRKIGEAFPQAGQVGYILRTSSRGQDQETLLQEATFLYQTYEDVLSRARYANIGTRLFRTGDSLCEKLLSYSLASVDEIVAETRELQNRVQAFCKLRRLTDLIPRIRVYEPSDRFGMEETYHLSSRLEEALKTQVFLPGGGYLLFEPGQTLCAIDVNSGSDTSGGGASHDKEQILTHINEKAVPAVVSQIRLRNLSGMIVVDFLHMKKGEDRDKIVSLLKQAFATDTRQVHVYGFSAMGLCEISRQKTGRTLRQMMA